MIFINNPKEKLIKKVKIAVIHHKITIFAKLSLQIFAVPAMNNRIAFTL